MDEMNINGIVSDVKFETLITDEVKAEMKKKVAEIKAANPKIKRVYPIVIEGDTEAGEKPFYIGYFKNPDLKTFSLFMASGQQDQVTAMYNLAKNLLVGGDKEVCDDDDLFLRGVMPTLSEITAARNTKIVNLSTAGE